MAWMALPLTALSVFLTRHQAEEERKKDESEKETDLFIKKYGISSSTKDTTRSEKMEHFSPKDKCDILLLGSGWISTFAVPVLVSKGFTVAATTRKATPDDKFDRIEFTFDDSLDIDREVEKLPKARTVVVVFPIRGSERTSKLVDAYTRLKSNSQWIQLGSSGIWGTNDDLVSPWIDRFTPPDITNERCIAEQEMLSLSTQERPTCVLNLAGLYGQERKPSNFLKRVQDKLETKGSVHFVHGVDVSRAILLLHEAFTPGQRWLLTDGRVHDWWNIALDKGEPGSIARVKVQALTRLLGIKALPRPICETIPRDSNDKSHCLIRALDSSHFWTHFDEAPLSGGLS
ncbi:hypothetical protein E3Q13_01460 [Wallemia mellicola]|nr:hypothetical protein E3Q13_01460 [Wallemia mellicola]